MKSISTLISDIKARLLSKEPFQKEVVNEFATNLASKLAGRLAEERSAPSLRLSNLGTKCDRKLWYSINTPELSEPLSASARLKFLYGDILEEVVLFLARAAGHKVTDEQKEVNVNGVRGHIDCRIDDELVDVKSASTGSFKKFKEHTLVDKDDFGYLDQLGSYRFALALPRAHFLAVDKTLGHLTLDTHEKTNKDYDLLVEQKREMLASTTPPYRAYADEKDGESGNRKLPFQCGYCPFKKTCWPGVRLFAYYKPRFLTKVVREPDVPELPLETPEE